MNEPADLVYLDEHGLAGSNFYWHKYAAHGLSKEDIQAAGLTDDRVRVGAALIEPLRAVDRTLRERGWSLFVKEGYRSNALYEIVYARRVEKYGKEATDRLLNIDARPHALGLSVDVAIQDARTGEEVLMRDGGDGIDALFLDFYRGKEGVEAARYQELQEYLCALMLERGFRIGIRREYFHFDYRPASPPNYP